MTLTNIQIIYMIMMNDDLTKHSIEIYAAKINYKKKYNQCE